MFQFRYYTARPIRLLKRKKSVALLRRGQDFAIDKERNLVRIATETYRCTQEALEKLVQMSRYGSEPPRPLSMQRGEIIPTKMSTAIRGSQRVLPPRYPLPYYAALFERTADVVVLMKRLFKPFDPARYLVGTHSGINFTVPIKLAYGTATVEAYLFVQTNRPTCTLMFLSKEAKLLDKLPTSKAARDAYRLFAALITSLSKKFALKPYPVEIHRALVHTNVHSGNLLSYNITF